MATSSYVEVRCSHALGGSSHTPRPEDGVAAALTKIGAHIGNPKKFAKASALLRELFSQGKLTGAHGDLVFECLRAAMRDPEQPRMLELRKEYVKLFSIASSNSQIFSAAEKGQLDVYGLLAVLRNQLQTDDSFVLNRTLARIKESVHSLPPAAEEDDAVLLVLKERMRGACNAEPSRTAAEAAEASASGEVHHGAAIEPDRRAVEADGAASEPQDRAAEQAACRPGPSSPEEDEPQSAAKASVIPADAAADTKEVTWTDEEALCMKRDALIACLEAAKELHSKLWARTSVEIAFEDAHSHRDQFCSSQQPRLDALARFAKEARLRRQQGRSAAKEDKRDRTAFETARREWSQATGISGRGALDGAGDHRSEVWLG